MTRSSSTIASNRASRSGSPRTVRFLIVRGFNRLRLFRGDERVALGKLFEYRRRLTKVRDQHVDRISGDPGREIDVLVDSGIEADQNPARFFADVFDRVPIPLRNVADV